MCLAELGEEQAQDSGRRRAGSRPIEDLGPPPFPGERDLASQGAAILLISSELPELLSLSDRLLALRSGRLVGEVTREAASEDTVLRLMAGVELADAG